MENAEQNIPVQKEGKQTDTIHVVDCTSQEEAHNFFLLVKERLKNVSMWHELSGPGTAKFSLRDAQGTELYKIAEKGDLFSIEIPLPGPIAGDGKEWVRIEAMNVKEDAIADSEYITMTVRPVASPTHHNKAPTAHFFSHLSTSTFIVERYLNRVSAAVHGRNETPNKDDTNFYDTVRNTIVALAAREGLSALQWKPLVIGLLKK